MMKKNVKNRENMYAAYHHFKANGQRDKTRPPRHAPAPIISPQQEQVPKNTTPAKGTINILDLVEDKGCYKLTLIPNPNLKPIL